MNSLIPAPLPADLMVKTPLPQTAVVVSGALLAEIDRLWEEMGAAPAVVDQPSMDAVRSVMARSRSLITQIDGARTASKAPYLAVGKTIDAAAKNVTARLQQIVDEAKGQIEDFIAERDRQIAELERQRLEAEAEARRVQQAALAAGQPVRPTAPLAVVPLPPEAVKAPIQTRPDVQVVDPSLVPREYLLLDMVKIRADALAGKVIPGVIVKQTTFVVAR